ncbi:MAG: hypothetical protein HYS27_25400 [Deltaproteobacteria bacterium]|nr:hypothetical protein [Deltaproteobacteria bacterium]
MERREPEATAPVALYEGPRVTLFRGWRLIALVAACVAVGVALHAGLAAWQRARVEHLVVDVDLLPRVPPATSSSSVVTWPMTLPGPAETTVTLSGIAIVHVWLQGCPDCMPAFEAIKRLAPEHRFRVPTFNVAYGNADPSWARSYGVDTNLGFDDGSHLVRPLGIGTFTTFVVDTRGTAVRVGSPAEEGYASRLQDAVDETTRASQEVPGDTMRTVATFAYLRGRSGELRRCVDWWRGTTATVVLSLRVDADGALVDVHAAPATTVAADPRSSAPAAACIERAVRRWHLGTLAPEPVELRVQIALGNDDRGE